MVDGNIWIFAGLLVTAGVPLVTLVVTQRSAARIIERSDARVDLMAQRAKSDAAAAMKQASEVASTLEKNTADVKRTAEEAAVKMAEVMKTTNTIHILVNSSLTKAIQGEFNVTALLLAEMEEGVEKDRHAGLRPTDDKITKIAAAKTRLAELAAELADRARAAAAVIEQQRIADLDAAAVSSSDEHLSSAPNRPVT